MRDFHIIDSRYFEVFWIATETLNFTKAAQEACMTQSGITQQIQKLEEQLAVKLFRRVKKKMYLTPAGHKLKKFVEKYLDEAKILSEELTQETSLLKGPVHYAMPSSCLISQHFPLLLQKREREFPEVQLHVEVCTNGEVYQKIINNEVDFGFVTKKIATPALHFIPFCWEEYIWVGSRDLGENFSPDDILKQNIISYPGAKALYEKWCKVYFPNIKTNHWNYLKIVGEINSLHGAICMVETDAGITIIPRHCVQEQLDSQKLFELCSEGKTINNEIHIVLLDNVQLAKRVSVVIDTFLEMHER